MKRNRGYSIFGASATSPERDGGGKLKGSRLEQAYRDLLLENQVLAESNQRLYERLSRHEVGIEESPIAGELMRVQRDALVERSRHMRELAYQTKNFEREKQRLLANNSRLAAALAQREAQIRKLHQRQETDALALTEAKLALREARNELAKITDRYYQLEARMQRPAAG